MELDTRAEVSIISEKTRKRESELAQLQKDREAQEEEHEKVLGDLSKKAKYKFQKGKGTLTANHHSLKSHVESQEKVNCCICEQ